MEPDYTKDTIAHEKLDPEVEDVATHLLLPGSVMHYFVTPRERHYPGYTPRLHKMEKIGKAAYEATANRTVAVMINTPEILSIQLNEDRKFKAQWEFTKACLENPTVDHIGYWYPKAPKARTLSTLASRTARSVMLTNDPDDRLGYEHSYAEMNDPKSRLRLKINQHGVSAFFLLEYNDRWLTIIRNTYKEAWIVGIKTPTEDMSRKIENIVITMEKLKLAKEERDEKKKKKKKEEEGDGKK